MSFIKQLAQLAGSAGKSVLSSVSSSLGQSLSAMILGGKNGYKNMQKSMFGTGMIDAQKEANAWTAQREDTAYQRSVADMQAAGLNPALMYGSAGSTSPSASTSPSDGASLSDMLGSATALSQIQSMEVQNKVSQKNAETARINADTERFNAETERMRLEKDKLLAETEMQVNDALIKLYGENAKVSAETVRKLAMEISDLESRISSRELHDVIDAVQVSINAGYLDLATNRFEQVELPTSIAEIAELTARKALHAAQVELSQQQVSYWKDENTRQDELLKLAQDKLKQQKHEFEETLKKLKGDRWFNIAGKVIDGAFDLGGKYLSRGVMVNMTTSNSPSETVTTKEIVDTQTGEVLPQATVTTTKRSGSTSTTQGYRGSKRK